MKELNLKFLVPLALILSFIFSSCATIEYKTKAITQPITLNNKIGAPYVELPKDARLISNVEGEVLHAITETHYTKTTTEKASADVDFMNAVKTYPNRCVTNLYFDVTGYMILGYSTKASIEYYGECYEIPKK